jgi:hypothetical protein
MLKPILRFAQDDTPSVLSVLSVLSALSALSAFSTRDPTRWPPQPPID